MNKNLNRRKLNFFNKKNIYVFILLIFLTFIINIYYFQKNYLINLFQTIISEFSHKYNYELTNIKLNNLNNIDKEEIINYLEKYYDTSIFLLPLERISNKIKEIPWVKNVKLTTDYKNNLFVEIFEYTPIGIYKFNNNFFYFDNNGKIINRINDLNKIKKSNLIIFIGKYANLKAFSLINILNSLDKKLFSQIYQIEYINNRRWNILLENNILLKISEDYPKKSLENFLKIKKKLSEAEINNINIFDLRDLSKTILVYK